MLAGFDRLVFQGHLRPLFFPGGMKRYCNANDLLLKEFKDHSQTVTKQLIAASEQAASAQNRPIEYLRSPKLRKEDHARRVAQRDGIQEGLIGVFRCVEPCLSFSLRGNGATKKLEFRPEVRQCLHLYHYYQHSVVGFMYARLQTWFPFTIQIGINGREWLARRLDEAGLKYRRHDNCFAWLEDVEQAQALMDKQLRTNWSRLLEEIRQQVHPSHPQLLGNCPLDYYWTLRQSEWASDIMFADPRELRRRYQTWLRFAMSSYRSVDIMRFLGRKLQADEGVGRFAGEVMSDLGRRVDGLRIKHRLEQNSIKMYDKASSVLRVETTINDPSAFKVYRSKEGEPSGPKDWRVLRSGVSDVHRRAQVSQSANERYAAGLAAVEQRSTLKEVNAKLAQRVREPGSGGRWLRGLNVAGEEDATLLEIVGRPEFAVAGLRNRDVVAALYASATTDPTEKRRRSSRVSRLLRLLRGHGLLKKIAKSHRYQVTETGRQAITAVLAAANASIQELTKLAA